MGPPGGHGRDRPADGRPGRLPGRRGRAAVRTGACRSTRCGPPSGASATPSATSWCGPWSAITGAAATLRDGRQVQGVPLSFIVEPEPGVRIYHFGDTTIFPGLRLIGELYRPTVGILGIAQTDGLPDPGAGQVLTGEMNPDEAALVAEWLGVRHAIGTPLPVARTRRRLSSPGVCPSTTRQGSASYIRRGRATSSSSSPNPATLRPWSGAGHPRSGTSATDRRRPETGGSAGPSRRMAHMTCGGVGGGGSDWLPGARQASSISATNRGDAPGASADADRRVAAGRANRSTNSPRRLVEGTSLARSAPVTGHAVAEPASGGPSTGPWWRTHPPVG